MPPQNSAAPVSSQRSPQVQQMQHAGQQNHVNGIGVVDMATEHEDAHRDVGASINFSVRGHDNKARGVVPTNTPTESEKLEEEGDGRATPTTPTSPSGPASLSTAHPPRGPRIHNHSAVPTNTPTGYESQEEEEVDEESRAYLTPPEDSTPSSPFQSLNGNANHDLSAVPRITTTGYETEEQQNEEDQATSSATEERRIPHRLTLRVAARGQSAHSLDSLGSAVTPAISTAGATIGDSEDMDGRATPGDGLPSWSEDSTPRDGLLSWSGESVVSDDDGRRATSITGATVGESDGDGDDVVATEADHAVDERRRHDTASTPTDARETYEGWPSNPGGDEASSVSEGPSLEIELTTDINYALRRNEEDDLRTSRIPLTVWNISRPVEEQQRHAAQHAADLPFTPQTPTHTPVVPAHLSRGALAADHLIPALNLAADQYQDVHSENRRQGSNAENSRRSEDSTNGLTLVPSNEEGVRTHSWHVVNGPTRELPGPDDQIDLRLPNPENLPTFQLLVTVPYRNRAMWPVSAHFLLPPNQPQDEIQDDQTGLLNIEVDRAVIWNNNDDVETVIHVGLRDSSPAAQFVAQLPRLPLSEINAEDQECPICREIFTANAGEVVQDEQVPEHPVRTPCGHTVGNQCLLRWLFGEPGYPPHSTCPACRGHLEVPQEPEPRPRVYSRPHFFEHSPETEQPRPPNQETITDEELETQLLTHLRQWTPEAERDSLGYADQSSWDHMRHRNETAARDAALAQELIPAAIYNAIPTYEAEQHLLFEAVRLRGFLGHPYITQGFGPRRDMDDEQLYEYLRSHGTYFYNRLGTAAWIRDGTPVDDAPLRRGERRAYLLWHIRTNPHDALYRASYEEIIDQGENYLRNYEHMHMLHYE